MSTDVTHEPVPQKSIYCNKCKNASAIKLRDKLECPICNSKDVEKI